ncbi:MAG TPA: hypothetical protein VF546_12535 [Pyrinomonadaceae bacterium]
MLKLFALALLSWLACLATILTWSYLFIETPSRADVLGFGSLTLLFAAPVCGLLYAPGLFWLRRRLGGCRPALLFPVAAVLLNAPVFVVSLVAARFKASMAVGEHALFIAGFVVMGLTFGYGFARLYRTPPADAALAPVAGGAAR